MGNANPLAVPAKQQQDESPIPEYAYTWGESQSGRVITHMIYQGFHVDEKGRMVFEGAQADGARRREREAFNYRWATDHPPPQAHRGELHASGLTSPSTSPEPGEYQVDPYRTRETGKRGDVLAVAKRLREIPKIMLDNHETEYWTRAASLPHTDVSGRA
jgi:hypothetical protein